MRLSGFLVLFGMAYGLSGASSVLSGTPGEPQPLPRPPAETSRYDMQGLHWGALWQRACQASCGGCRGAVSKSLRHLCLETGKISQRAAKDLENMLVLLEREQAVLTHDHEDACQLAGEGNAIVAGWMEKTMDTLGTLGEAASLAHEKGEEGLGALPPFLAKIAEDAAVCLDNMRQGTAETTECSAVCLALCWLFRAYLGEANLKLLGEIQEWKADEAEDWANTLGEACQAMITLLEEGTFLTAPLIPWLSSNVYALLWQGRAGAHTSKTAETALSRLGATTLQPIDYLAKKNRHWRRIYHRVRNANPRRGPVACALFSMNAFRQENRRAQSAAPTSPTLFFDYPPHPEHTVLEQRLLNSLGRNKTSADALGGSQPIVKNTTRTPPVPIPRRQSTEL